MIDQSTYRADPECDLRLERDVDVAPDLIWRAWTRPELIVKWFTPAPWTTLDCRIDLRPGGEFYTLMQSPEGKTFPNTGCYLEIIDNRKLVWTDMLGPGFRPTTAGFFTGTIILEPIAKGTRYLAIGQHKDTADRKKHEDMGFEKSWDQALRQLVQAVKALS